MCNLTASPGLAIEKIIAVRSKIIHGWPRNDTCKPQIGMGPLPPNGNKTEAVLWLALGVGIGAAFMYLLDPVRRSSLVTAFSKQMKEQVNDAVLEERVRNEFHKRIHHARSIQIEVQEGVVTVSGPIL